MSNIGGSASFSISKALVQNPADFSLFQTTVNYTGANGIQTLEAGWIDRLNQVGQPHLFTYYTTEGYASQGNDTRGWNRDCTGWVQYDTLIYPGTSFPQKRRSKHRRPMGNPNPVPSLRGQLVALGPRSLDGLLPYISLRRAYP